MSTGSHSQFVKISRFDKTTQKIVFGYIRRAQQLFPANNPNYIIPHLIIQICLSYYFMKDKFDKTCIGSGMELSNDDKCCTMISQMSCSAYLKNIIEHGVYHWRFKINKCASNDAWYMTIGIWKVKDDDIPKTLPLDTWFCNKGYYDDGKPRSYAFASNTGQKIRKIFGSPPPSSKELSYGERCKTNDIVDMYCDLEKYELRFTINDIDYGKICDIEKGKYRAAINLYHKDDSITLLDPDSDL